MINIDEMLNRTMADTGIMLNAIVNKDSLLKLVIKENHELRNKLIEAENTIAKLKKGGSNGVRRKTLRNGVV